MTRVSAGQLDLGDHDELEAIRVELDRADAKREAARARAPRGFDPAALFLLDLGWQNLYEPTSATQGTLPEYRCKGCSAVLTAGKREQHYRSHRRTRDGHAAPQAPAPVEQPTLGA